MNWRFWGLAVGLAAVVCIGWHLALLRFATDGMVGDLNPQEGLFRLHYLAPPDSVWADNGVAIYQALLRVDGKPIEDWLTTPGDPASWQSGRTHRYTVIRRDNGETKVISAITQYPTLAALPAYLGPAALATLLTLLAAILISRRQTNPPLLLMACGSLIGLSWNTFSSPFSYLALGTPFWGQVALHVVGTAVMVGSWVHLALTFPAPLPWYIQHRWLGLALAYGIYPLGLLILIPLPASLFDHVLAMNAWGQLSTIGLKGAAYIAWGAQYRRATVAGRGQLHWVLAANTIFDLPFLVAAISNDNGPLSIAQGWLALFPPLGYMMAALPSRRLRITLQPTSGLIHGIANTLSAALFLSGLGLAAILLTQNGQAGALPIITAILAIFFAVTTAPLAGLLREQLDSWFQGTRGAQRALLHEFTGKVSDEISLDMVARAFSEVLDQAIQPAFAMLWLWDDESHALVSVLTVGHPPDSPAILRLDDAGYHLLIERTQFTQERAAFPWLKAFYCYLSWVSSGELVGVCAIGPRADERTYSGDTLRFFETLGRSATLAFRNAQLVSQLEEKISALRHAYRQLMTAQDSERRSLAAELHDETLQQFAHIALVAGSIQRAVNADSRAAQIQDLQRVVIHTEQRLREILRGIHPAVLTNLGLISALTAWLPQAPGIKISLSAQGFEDRRLLDPDLEMTLYRLTQESVNNALQHARATRIDIRLSWIENETILEIADDGVGFEPAVYLASLRSATSPSTGHFGLLNLRERVSALDGQLTIDSGPGHGTTIRVRLPVSALMNSRNS